MTPEDALPLVSIVVPVFNASEHLRDSLDSILAQTYRSTEVIVMDDASTDGTGEIARSYGDAVIYHRQPHTRDAFGNINDGIALASGELVAVYHGDDVYLPQIVEREVDFLREHPEAGAVFTSDIFIDRQGHPFGRLELPSELRGGGPFDYATILNCLLSYKNVFLRCPSSMVRASVYAEVGEYRDELKETSDVEMWLRIARRYPLGILEEHLFRYRRGHSSMSERYDHLRAEPARFFLVMDEHLTDGNDSIVTREALAAYRAHKAEDRMRMAVSMYIRGEREEAARILRRIAARDLAGSRRVQRGRLLVLLAALRLLVRLPRSALAAGLFYRRWHKLPGEAAPLRLAQGETGSPR
jgi:glycosyltransferase involved in cell wall biosynthesis